MDDQRFSFKNGLRLFIAGDDGAAVFDSGKCSVSSTNANQIYSLITLSIENDYTTYTGFGNTYVNYNKKIALLNNLLSSNNTVGTLATIQQILGTAGGNSINENHNTRPEILGAIFNPVGVAYAQRYSSSTGTFNYYEAVRAGISSEINLGTTRVNVPMVFSS